jgi:hypothetical protein
LVAGLSVTLSDTGGKLDFVFGAEKFDLPDFPEIQLERCVGIIGGMFAARLGSRYGNGFVVGRLGMARRRLGGGGF